MYIYSMKESKMVVATVNAVKEVSQCAENSSYYKKLLQALELPEFIHYDLALKYFLSAFKQIKHYVTVNGVFPTNDGKQYKLRQEMDFLCDVFGKKDGVERIAPWNLEGDSLVIDNHADAELFMAVVNMVNAIEKLSRKDDDYFVDLNDQLPNIFNDYYKNMGIKRIAHDVFEVTTWYIDKMGWIGQCYPEVKIIKENLEQLQLLLGQQKVKGLF